MRLEDRLAASAEYEHEARRQAIFGPIAGLLIIAAIFLMTAKPGL